MDQGVLPLEKELFRARRICDNLWTYGFGILKVAEDIAYLIHSIKENQSVDGSPCFCYYETVKPDTVEELPRSKWIPIEDQMPETNEPVLVTTGDGTVTMGTWYGYRWGTSVCYDADVLAWMKKPESYNPDN